MPEKRIILVAGPTAVGKSDCSIQLAKYYNTEILSADSRQCFCELRIGTAVPSENDLKEVRHHFVHSHSIHDEMSAAIYESYALDVLRRLFETKDTVIVCGGTGLYIQALLYGMDDMPDVDKVVEEEVNEAYNIHGIDYLKSELIACDTDYSSHGNMVNPARMLRALIFFKSTGTSILHYQNNIQKKRDFEVIKIGLELPREELYQRINQRVDLMILGGLLEEVETMYDHRHLKALQTVGYQEFYDWSHWPLQKEELSISIEKVKQNSRRYAKRQMTWFRNRESLKWFHPNDIEGIIKYIDTLMLS